MDNAFDLEGIYLLRIDNKLDRKELDTIVSDFVKNLEACST
jgi:hypothetical protein